VSRLWGVDLPHIRQHNQTCDEDNDAESRAGGQHKGLFQGHEPSSQMSPNSHCKQTNWKHHFTSLSNGPVKATADASDEKCVNKSYLAEERRRKS